METNKSLIKYYENYFDLFTHPGWQQLIKEIEEELNGYKESVFDVDKEVFPTIKGRVEILRRIVHLPQLVEQGYKMVTENDDSL